MKTALIVGYIASAAAAQRLVRPPPGCAYDNCFWRDRIPAEWRQNAENFCRALVGTQPAATSTVTVTSAPTTLVTTNTPTTVVQTTQSTITVTVSQTSGTVCSTSITGSVTTSVSFPTFNPLVIAKKRDVDSIEARDDLEHGRFTERQAWPHFAGFGCRRPPILGNLEAACRCFLQAPAPVPVVTITVTQTPSGSTVATTTPTGATTTLAPTTTTITTTNTITATITTCTSTSTATAFDPISNCGAPAGTYATATTGQITCAQPAAAPAGSVNAFHRIEGDDTQGTIFEGCIYAGPRSITTPSGGTHQCGPNTGTSITDQLDAAAQLRGFDYDGTFSQTFNDYFITRIAATAQNGNQYWGVLDNGVFTPSGGCTALVQPGDSSLWQFNAFNVNGLLTITPQYAVAQAGSPVSITVTSMSPNGGDPAPFAGATLSGNNAQSDATGAIAFTAPTVPGCYQYKATADGQGRSNAFYLNVVAAFPAVIA